MKILLVTHTFLPNYVGGTEVYTYELAKTLSKNHEVVIFTTEPLDKNGDYEIKADEYYGITVYRLRKNIKKIKNFEKTYNDDKVIPGFKVLLQEFKPDIIHYQHLMHLSINLIQAGYVSGIPQIMTVNDFWLQTMLFNRITSKNALLINPADENLAEDLANLFTIGFFNHNRFNTDDPFKMNIKYLTKKILYRFIGNAIYHLEKTQYVAMIKKRNYLIRKNLALLDLAIFPTLFLYRDFCKWGFYAKKVIVSSHGVNVSLFNNFHKKAADKIRFAFIGSIINSKGLDILLKAWKELNSNKIVLKIYGDLNTDPKYSIKIYKLLKGLKNVQLCGTFDSQKIANVYKEIDILIVPSRWFEECSFSST